MNEGNLVKLNNPEIPKKKLDNIVVNLAEKALKIADEIGIDDPEKIKIIQEHLEREHMNGRAMVLHQWPFAVSGFYRDANEELGVEFPARLYHEAMIYAAWYMRRPDGESEAAAICPTIPWIEDELENNGLGENLIKRVYVDIAIPYAQYKIRQFMDKRIEFSPSEEIKVHGALSPKDCLDISDNEQRRAIKVRFLVALIIQCLVESLIYCQKNNKDLTVKLVGGDKPEIIITPFEISDADELVSSYHYSHHFNIQVEKGHCIIKPK